MSRPLLKKRRYPGAVLLVVLSFLTALFAAGVPGLVEKQLTGSLQQTLDGTGSVARAATAVGNARLTTGDLGKAQSLFASGVPAAMRPQTGQGWSGSHLVERLPVQSTAFHGTLDVEYRTSAAAHLRLVTGSMPNAGGVVNGVDEMDIALTSASAKFYGAHVGSVITSGSNRFHVTGIVEPADPSSAFWNYDPELAAPSPRVTPEGNTEWTTAGLIGPGELSALGSVLQFDGAEDPITSIFCVPLDTAAYSARDVGSLLGQMSAFASGTVPTELGAQVTAGPAISLADFQSQRDAVSSILSLIMVGVATVGCATVLLCARLVVGRRRTHFTLLRARGQSLPQLALHVLGGLGPATAVALAAAGVLAAILAGGKNAQSLTLLGAVAAIVLAGPPLLAVLEHRGTTRLRGGDDGDQVRRRPKGRRRVFELVIVLLTVGAVAALRQRGLGGSGSNTLGALTPILIAAVATAVAIRCYPLVLTPAARLARRRNGATAFLGLAGAVRSSLTLALPTFGIVLALTLAALGGLAFRNIESGRAEESWLQTGADVSIALSTGTDPAQAAKAVAALERIPGVTHATAVANQTVNGSTQDSAVYAVDPETYTAVTADSPWPFAGALPAQRVPGPVPVIVSADSGYKVGTVFQLTPGAAPAFQARVAGVQAQSPARPAYGPTDPFILVPAWATTTVNPKWWLATEIMVSGNGIDPAQITAALAHTVPGANRVLYRADALDRLTHQPLEGLAEFGYALGLVAAGCFGICGILLALALTAAPRSRRLMLLGTLGLSPRQARGIALAETGPLAASTALGGLLAALTLPAVFGSALNLTEFTGLASETGLRLDASVPVLTVAAALVLTACGVLLQAAIARRRSVSAQLRMGEEA
jgi:putative ABC transport system permease protein